MGFNSGFKGLILTGFPQQKRLHKHTSMLRYTHIVTVCYSTLVNVIFIYHITYMETFFYTCLTSQESHSKKSFNNRCGTTECFKIQHWSLQKTDTYSIQYIVTTMLTFTIKNKDNMNNWIFVKFKMFWNAYGVDFCVVFLRILFWALSNVVTLYMVSIFVLCFFGFCFERCPM